MFHSDLAMRDSDVGTWFSDAGKWLSDAGKWFSDAGKWFIRRQKGFIRRQKGFIRRQKGFRGASCRFWPKSPYFRLNAPEALILEPAEPGYLRASPSVRWIALEVLYS
jgi:hypothetical protein